MIVLCNARIIIGTDKAPVARGFIAVQDELILEVGAGDPGPLPADALVLDAGGRTALPGLMDCHVHLVGFHSQRHTALTPESIATDTLELVAGLRDYVRSGVTGLRDCGYPHHGIFAIRETAQRGQMVSPRLYLSGRALTASGGHGGSISVEVDGVDAVRRAVRIECKAGADWIKLMATGGTATPGELVSDVQMTVEEMAVAVDEAHRRSKKVCAHCSNLAGSYAVLEAGVDSLEHGIELDEVCVQRMREQGTWLSPSLKCTQIEGEAGPESGIADYVRAKAAQIYRKQMRSFQRALEAGVGIAASTDAGPFYLPLSGRSLAWELALMVELGMTAQQAIASATCRAAEMLGVGSRVGTLESGKLADILVVEGDPLEDIEALQRPWKVMLGGRIVE